MKTILKRSVLKNKLRTGGFQAVAEYIIDEYKKQHPPKTALQHKKQMKKKIEKLEKEVQELIDKLIQIER